MGRRGVITIGPLLTEPRILLLPPLPTTADRCRPPPVSPGRRRRQPAPRQAAARRPHARDGRATAGGRVAAPARRDGFSTSRPPPGSAWRAPVGAPRRRGRHHGGADSTPMRTRPNSPTRWRCGDPGAAVARAVRSPPPGPPGNQRRRVPVPHRSSARSATIRPLALTPSGSRGLGMACKLVEGTWRRGRIGDPSTYEVSGGLIIAKYASLVGHDTSYRCTSMHDQHRLAPDHLRQQTAQPVLGFGHADLLHRATLA